MRARSIYLSDNLVAKVGDFDFAILMEDDCPIDDPQGRVSTLEPLYKVVHCVMILDIGWFNGGPQKCCIQTKCIDYIEK